MSRYRHDVDQDMVSAHLVATLSKYPSRQFWRELRESGATDNQIESLIRKHVPNFGGHIEPNTYVIKVSGPSLKFGIGNSADFDRCSTTIFGIDLVRRTRTVFGIPKEAPSLFEKVD